MRRYQLREEYFGYTFFDNQTIRHKFLLKKEWDRLRLTLDPLGSITYLPIRRTDYKRGLLYCPTRIYYELTLRCNLRCRYCFNSSGEPRKQELTTSQILNSFENLRRNNVMDIRFTGGEIVCRPDWYEVLKEAKKLGFAISCNTNGVYGRKIWDKIARLKLEQVTISLDGRKESHERNRGKGTFEPTLTTLKELFKRGVNTRVNTLLSKDNIEDIEYIVDMVNKYTTEINCFAVRFFGRGQEFEKTETITFNQLYQISEKIKLLQKRYPLINIIYPEQPMVENSSREEENKKYGLIKCVPDGATRFNITSDGRLWPGGYLPYIDNALSVGNIVTDDLFEVWQRSEKLTKFRKEATKLIEFCEKCKEFMKKCPGANYEREAFRRKNPGRYNSYCIYGHRPSLLNQFNNE